MNKNFLKRIKTSIFLLFLLFIINFSNQFIFILSVLILGLIVCVEANSIFYKLSEAHISKYKQPFVKVNYKFLIMNLTTFCYIFFVFCNFSYQIHKFESPTFFFI